MKKTVLVSLMLVMVFCLTLPTYAMDQATRFFYNDQDSIIVGQVTSVKEDSLEIAVSGYVAGMTFVAGIDSTEGPRFAQLRPKTVTLQLADHTFQTGDYIGAGVDLENGIWTVPWLYFHVDGGDPATLQVLSVSKGNIDPQHVTTFFNTGGADPLYGGATSWAESSFEYSSSFTMDGMRYAVYQPKPPEPTMVERLSDSLALVLAAVVLMGYLGWRFYLSIQKKKA